MCYRLLGSYARSREDFGSSKFRRRKWVNLYFAEENFPPRLQLELLPSSATGFFDHSGHIHGTEQLVIPYVAFNVMLLCYIVPMICHLPTPQPPESLPRPLEVWYSLVDLVDQRRIHSCLFRATTAPGLILRSARARQERVVELCARAKNFLQISKVVTGEAPDVGVTRRVTWITIWR